MSGTAYKGKIGEEDLFYWQGGADPTTFTRRTSTGGEIAMTKFGAGVTPVLRTVTLVCAADGTLHTFGVIQDPGGGDSYTLGEIE